MIFGIGYTGFCLPCLRCLPIPNTCRLFVNVPNKTELCSNFNNKDYSVCNY